MNSLSRLGAFAARFRRAREGQVSILFAAIAIPTLVTVGAAVDYSRAVGVRSQVQIATDAAALAAAQRTSGTLTDAQTAATQAFAANYANSPGIGSVVITPISGGTGWHAAGSVQLPTTFMQLAAISSLTVGAVSEAAAFAGGGAIEVALVLDNTGSMLNDMTSLKTAATNLTNKLFDAAQNNPNFRMSVVPFVAAVNPGLPTITQNGNAMIDTMASSRYNGQALRPWGWIATNVVTGTTDCVPDGGSGGGGGWVDPGAGGGDKKSEKVLEPLTKFASQLFGVSSARADTTPATKAPLSGKSYTSSSPDGGNGQFVPNGFSVDGPYDQGASNKNKGCVWLQNPGVISNYDMFSRIPATTTSGGSYSGWKGCVEARPKPYDITDDAPSSANPDTLYVPYFAPDDGDAFDTSWVPTFNNNYLPDGYLDPAAKSTDLNKILMDPTGKTSGKLWDFKWDLWSRQNSLLKYNGVNKADIKDYVDSLGNHITTGPNANCPDAVLPLTSSRSDVLNKISSLTHWAGGGTIVPEGLTWGLRSLSPNLPYALGKPYDPKTQKVIVLMTDGKNELALNGANWGPTVSDYTSYGYFNSGAFAENNVQTFADATTYLNNRLIAACDYAKAKPGVKIYTVLFRETDPTIKSLLSQCASDPKNAFTASDGPALTAAFGQISGNIAQLRLSR